MTATPAVLHVKIMWDQNNFLFPSSPMERTRAKKKADVKADRKQANARYKEELAREEKRVPFSFMMNESSGRGGGDDGSEELPTSQIQEMESVKL